MIIKQIHEKQFGEELVYGGLICFILEKKCFVFPDLVKTRMKRSMAIDGSTLTYEISNGTWCLEEQEGKRDLC